MMDFNLILLLVGLGLLVLVAVFVLLGCFAGLKKELNCAAIGFVVLLLTLLVFGNSSTILDANGSLLKNFIQGIPSSAETIWDCVLALVQTNVPGGAEIFVEGTKSYAFLYSVVSGVARGAMLIIGTLIMFILATIGIGIYRLVTRIVACKKAKKRAAEGVVEPLPKPDKAMNDNVLVAQSGTGESEGVIITANKEPNKGGPSKHRAWAGALAGLRAVIAIIFLFAPVSGVCSILDQISPETEKLLNESLSGNKQNTAESDTIVDIVIDFKDAYYDSAVGKFIEGSKFFFGESFSTQLFDGAFVIKTDNNKIVLREEAIVIVDAANALQGNLNLKELEFSHVANALDALKDSKLIVEAMPVAIETAYYLPINEKGNISLMGDYKALKDLLFVSKQQAAFLELRQLDWDKNIEILFDTVKEAYKLGILEDDFNYLTMDTEQLSITLEQLLKSDAIKSILNIAVQTALKLDVVKNLVGELPAADLSNFSWEEEFQTIVSIYDEFKKLGITSFSGLDVGTLINNIKNDEAKINVIVSLVEKVTKMQLVNEVGYNAALGYVENMKLVQDCGTDVVKAVKDLKNVDWSNDIKIYVDAVIEALPLVEFGEGFKISADYLNLDVETIKAVVDTLFTTESFEKVLPIAANVGLNIALSNKAVTDFLGKDIEVVIDTSVIDWKQEVYTLVGIYEEFQKLGIKSIENLNIKDELTKIANDNAKLEILKNVVRKVTELKLVEQTAFGIAIDYVAKIELVKDAGADIVEAVKELKNNDWASDVNIYVDALIEALPLIEISEGLKIEFDYLNLDVNVIKNVVDILFTTESFEKILPIATNIALDKVLENEKVKEFIGEQEIVINTSNLDWKQELMTFVDMYGEFQKFEITSLKGLDVKSEVVRILNDESKYDAIANVVKKVTESQLLGQFVYDVAIEYLSTLKIIVDAGDETVKAVKDLKNNDWAKDLNIYVDAALKALPLIEINEGLKINVDYLLLDADQLKAVVDTLFTSESFVKVLPIAAEIALDKALANDKIKELIGDQEVEISFENINWEQDFTSLVNMYKTFQELEIRSINEFKVIKTLAQKVLGSNAKVESLKSVVLQLADTTLYNDVIVPFASPVVNQLISTKAENFEGILDLSKLDKEEWKNDLVNLVEIANNVYRICKFEFNLASIDFVLAGTNYGTDTVELLFNLNLLDGNQTKIDLVIAVLKQFKVFDDEQLSNIDLSDVVWTSNDGNCEVVNLQQILTILGKAVQIEGLDLNHKQFNYNQILSNDNTYAYAVDLLDVVVDSKLILEFIPSILEKYLLPKVEQWDDEDSTLNKILTELESDELVLEVQKLVDVVKAIIDLNVLDYKSEGIQAIDFGNTTALKTIINGIFDSKLLEGYESRVIRILFKVTKLFPDLEKGTFDHVDFDREQALLIAAIDELEVVLKDENFLTFDENNKLKLDKQFYLKEETLDAFLGALKLLFGEYTENSSVEGSQIVETLLPEIFDKFIINLVPSQFADLMEILNIEGSHPRLLSDDVRKVLYIAELLIDEKVQSYLLKNDYNFANAAETLQEVVNTVFKLNIVNGSEAEIVAWALNYVQTAAKFNLGEVEAKDFATVDWDAEVVAINELLEDFIKFTNNNKISTVNKLVSFIKNKDFLKDEYHETFNLNIAFELVEDLFNLQTVEHVLPIALEYALNLAKEKNFDVSFLGDNMTAELLVEDAKSIVEALKIAVYDVQILDYVKSKWTGELPAVEHVVAILDIVVNLNLIETKENQLLRYLVDKFIPKNSYINGKDFSFDYQYDFDHDYEIIRQALPLIYELIYANNITKIEQVKAFFVEKWYANTDLIKDYNITILCDIVELISDTHLVEQALLAVVNNAVKLDALTKIADFSSLTNLTKPELVSDLKTIVNIVRQALDAGLLQYYEMKDLDPINYEALANILETVGTLNMVNMCGNDIVPQVINYVLSKNSKLNIDHEFTKQEFAEVNWAEETVVLGKLLIEVGELLENNNLDALSDILLFIDNKDYTYPAIFTDANAYQLVDILSVAVESKLVKAVSVVGFEFALNILKDKGFDITFLKGKLTSDELVSDLYVIVEIARNAIDFGAIEYLTTKNIYNLDTSYLVNIVALLEELNILTCAQPEWTALVISKVAPLLKLDLTVIENNYKYINYAEENLLLQEALVLIGELLDNENIHSIDDIKHFIANKDYLDINAYNDRAIANAQDLLLLAAESDILGVHLVDLFEYAASIVSSKTKYDISFVNDIFTTPELQADIKKLVEISDYLIEFGIIDLIFTGDVVINLDPVIEAVKLLEEVNILYKTNDYIAEIVYNMILPKLGIEDALGIDDFKYINFAEENKVLVKVLEEAKVLLAAENFTNVSDVVSFVKNKEYLYSDKYEQTFNDAAIESAFRLAQLAVTSELVKLELVPLFNLAVSKIPAKVDVAFLKDSVTVDELVSDVDVLIEIARHAIDFGVLEYVFTKNIEVVELDPVIEIVKLLEELNIAKNNNKEFTALVFNLVYDKLGINKDSDTLAKQSGSNTVLASEFVGVDYANENVILQEVLDLVGWLQADFMLTSLEEILAFVKNKEYLNYKEFAPIVYSHALDIVNAGMESVLVQYSLPTLLDFGLDKANAKGIDLTFLSGAFTGEQLANDVKILAKEAVTWIRDNQVLDLKETKAIKANYFDDLAKTILALENVNLVNYEQTKLVTVLTNVIYKNVFKYSGSIEESYFDGVDWSKEFANVADVLVKLGDIAETFGVEHNLLSLDGLKEFKANAKNLELYNDDELLANVAELLVAVSRSSALLSELEFGQEYLISFLAKKNMYVASIYTSKEGIAEDLVALSDVLAVVYPSNVLGFASGKEELNQGYVNELVSAIKAVLNMNILEKSKADVLDIVFDKLKINVDKAELEAIVWENAETEVIGDLLLAVNDLLVNLDILTIDELKAINVKEYLKINKDINERLTVIKEVLESLLESQLVEAALFGISEKYLSNDKVAGLGDLHNIYNSYAEVEADLNKLVATINAVIELNIYSFLAQGADIPYEKKAAIEAIINNVFTLNYLNNDGRISEIVAKVSPKDLSDIDFSGINLTSDAALLVAAYEELLPILTHEEFFIKNKADLKAITFAEIKYFAKDEYMSSIRNGFSNILDTTLVTETNGAIFLLVVPLIKKAAPEYYEAIDPERLTVEQLGDDVKAIFDLVEKVINADLSEIFNGMIFNDDTEQLIYDVINTIANLNLLDDRFDEVALVTADKLDSKRIGTYFFDKELYNLEDVMYKEDLLALIDIIAVIYDLCEIENIATLGDAKAHFGNKDNIVALFKNVDQVNNIETLVNLATELTFVKHNILPVYGEALQAKVAELLSKELADVSDVYDSSEAMTEELVQLVKVLRDLIDLGVFDALAGANINYDQAAAVKKLLADVAEIEYVNVKKQNILEFVDSKVKADLSQLDVSSMDLANDLAVFGEIYEQLIPVLLSVHNPFTTVEAIKARAIAKSDLFALIYDYQSIYPSVVTLLSEVSIAPQVVKFAADQAENKLSGLAKELVEVLNVDNASDADIIEDLVVSAEVLSYVEKLDVLRKVLYKEDIAVTDNETISALLAAVFKLNMVDDNFVELIKVALEDVLHLDISNIDLVINDVENEQALLVQLADKGVITMNALGIENLSDVKPAIKDIKNVLINGFVNLDGYVVTDIVNLLCQSELVAKVTLPAYEQKVYPKLTGIYATIGDISNYSEELFVEDLALIAQITKDIKDSGLDKLMFALEVPTEDAIPYLENVVRNICMLNIIDVKKADVPTVVQTVLDNAGLTSIIRNFDEDFDLSKHDLSEVSFKADADIYASMAPQLYKVLKGLVEANFDLPFFGNTDAVTALVEMYEISLDTSLVKVVAAKGLNGVDKVATMLGVTLNQNDEEVLNNVADFLYGLIKLGIFSNNGIDFTDADTIDEMIQAIYNSVSLPEKVRGLVDRVVARLYAYGVVPFDWNLTSLANEVNVISDLIEQVANFGYEFALETLVNPGAQTSINSMISTLADSSFVEQLFFPFVEGTYKALTLSYTDGEMVYDATLDDVIKYSLPNFWRVVNAVYEITGFNVTTISVNNILANLDAVAEIVEVFGTDIMLKDNVAKIIATGIGAFTSYDLTDEQLAKLIAIDFENEVVYSNAFFAKLQETYNNYPFSLDTSMLKDENVVKGLADAVEAILPSETVKVLARIVMKVANNKVIANVLPDASALITDRLNDSAYTDELIVDDLYSLVEILRFAADSGILTNATEFTTWNFDAIRNIVDLCFDTNIAAGYENEFAEACITVIPGIDEYYNSSMVIADWEAEINTLINVMESLVNDGITDFDSINVDKLSGATVSYINDSTILSTVLVDTINEKLVELGLDEYYVATKAKLDLVNDWDVELDAIRDLTDLLDSFDNGTYVFSTVVSVYNNIRNNTVLVNDILVSCAPHVVPKMPVVSDYYNDSMVIADWTLEMDNIVKAVEELDKAGLTTITDPLDTRITGELLYALAQSEIITNAMVKEINESLVEAGLPDDEIHYQDIKDVTTVEAWNTEIKALRSITDFNKNISSKSMADIIEIYDTIDDSHLCEIILDASAETIVPELPIIGSYYDEHVHDVMAGKAWHTEFEDIVNAYRELVPNGLEHLGDPLDMHSKIDGEVMVALTKSQILSNGIAKEINKSLVKNDLDIYKMTLEDVQSVTTVDEWNKELGALRELVSLGALNSGNELNDSDRAEIIDAVQTIETTILCKKVLSESAKTLVPKLPVIKNYPSAYANVADDKWDDELFAIIDALDVLPINIPTVENPIEELSGEMMVASFKSEILTKAITQEFNANLVNLGLPFTVVEADLTSIQTAAEWDTELAAIKKIKEVLDNYEDGTVTYAQVMELYNKVVNETVLAEKILVKALDDRDIL